MRKFSINFRFKSKKVGKLDPFFLGVLARSHHATSKIQQERKRKEESVGVFDQHIFS